jgi:hypothetical protein
LLSKGHLKDLLGRKKSKTQDAEKAPERAPSPPPNAKVINFISGGSDICGTSYSAAKKRAVRHIIFCTWVSQEIEDIFGFQTGSGS